MNELIAEWKEGMQIRKTDIEETEATTRRSAGNHYPRPKITVTQRCRAENVQLGNGKSMARLWRGGERWPRT